MSMTSAPQTSGVTVRGKGQFVAPTKSTFQEIVNDLWFTHGLVVTAIYMRGSVIPRNQWDTVPSDDLRIDVHVA